MLFEIFITQYGSNEKDMVSHALLSALSNSGRDEGSLPNWPTPQTSLSVGTAAKEAKRYGGKNREMFIGGCLCTLYPLPPGEGERKDIRKLNQREIFLIEHKESTW